MRVSSNKGLYLSFVKWRALFPTPILFSKWCSSFVLFAMGLPRKNNSNFEQRIWDKVRCYLETPLGNNIIKNIGYTRIKKLHPHTYNLNPKHLSLPPFSPP
jgi:hypothetical protein